MEQSSNPLESESYADFKSQFREEPLSESDQDTSALLLSILDFKVQSQFFDADSDDLGVDKLDLISFTESEFEI